MNGSGEKIGSEIGADNKTHFEKIFNLIFVILIYEGDWKQPARFFEGTKTFKFAIPKLILK